jgi:hypothetical protein
MRLRTLYVDAVEKQRRAVNEVLEVRCKASNQEYDRMRGLADQARDAARLALSQHKREHNC